MAVEVIISDGRFFIFRATVLGARVGFSGAGVVSVAVHSGHAAGLCVTIAGVDVAEAGGRSIACDSHMKGRCLTVMMFLR